MAAWMRPFRKREMPEGLWTKCDVCKAMLFQKELAAALKVCTKCGHHFRMSAQERIDSILDPGSFQEVAGDLEAIDALGVPRIEMPGGEADDIIGTLATAAEDDGMVVVIVSSDKDLYQLVSERAGVRGGLTERRVGWAGGGWRGPGPGGGSGPGGGRWWWWSGPRPAAWG